MPKNLYYEFQCVSCVLFLPQGSTRYITRFPLKGVLGVKGVRKIKKAWAVQCARALKKGFAFLFSQDPFYPEDLNQRKSCYIWLTSAHQKNHLQVTRIQCFPKSLKTVFGNFLETLKRKLNGAGALQSRI